MSQPDSPTDFTHPALQSLDTLLRCLICREYYTAPLSISSCSHTFCAECLYSSLKVAKKCPSCRAEADEGRLKKNNALEDVVRGWKDAR
jgi:E3 ubiquitin-protein ligase RAD18